MSRVERKTVRKPSSVTAYLYSADGWPLGQCHMLDVSTTGAKLVHDIEDDMPERFLLSFSRDGKVRRLCQAVWKKDNEVGVRFVKN
jgi:hypothetical protein